MNTFGIIILSQVPIRAQNSHRSEMVTQALFGELFKILETSKEWSKIQLSNDGYVGFIQNEQWLEIKNINNIHFFFNSNNHLKVTHNGLNIQIPIGATIWKNNLNHEILSQYIFSKRAENYKVSNNSSSNNIIKTALKFRRAPYLWGGKTTAGIDCSGLVQIVFQVNGIQLPRDAYQQEEMGSSILFKDCKSGDLAFFTQGSDKISHVGIIYRTNKTNIKIIHSSAFVRLDSLDEKGISSINDQNEITYSHQLKSIKRILLS